MKTSVEKVLTATNSWLHAQSRQGQHRYDPARAEISGLLDEPGKRALLAKGELPEGKPKPAMNKLLDTVLRVQRPVVLSFVQKERADHPDDSAFQVPAHLRRDDVVVAFSTGGASPLLARRLRERLEAVVTPGLGRAASRLSEVREEVQARWPADEGRRRAFWFELITPEFLDLAVAGRDEDVEQAIRRCLSQS